MADVLVQPIEQATPVQQPPVEPQQPQPPQQQQAPAEPQAAAAAPAPSKKELGATTKQFLGVIKQVPALQAVLAGTPPAVSAPIKEFQKRDEAQLILKNKDALMKGGFGFYQSLSGDLGVVFNMLHIHPEDIKSADQQGKLLQVAPPFDALNAAVAKSGLKNPLMLIDNHPNGMAPQRSATVPPQAGSGAGAPTAQGPAPARRGGSSGGNQALQRALLSKRLLNMSPGAPTSGPEPGAGRILNQIMTPAV